MMSPTRRRPSRISRSTTSPSSRRAGKGRSASASCSRPGARPRRPRPRASSRARGAAAPLPPPALGRAGPGRPRLLVDGIARPHRATPAAAYRASPQAAPGVSAMAARTVRPSPSQSSATWASTPSSPPYRCAAPVRSIISPAGAPRPPRGKSARPSGAGQQEPRLGQRVGGHGQKGGTVSRWHRAGVGPATDPQPQPRREGHQHLRAVAVAHHSQRHGTTHPRRRMTRSAASRGNHSERMRRPTICAPMFPLCS